MAIAVVTIYKGNGDVLLTYMDATHLQTEAGILTFNRQVGYAGPGRQQIRTNMEFFVVEQGANSEEVS